tara:strand:+ start:70 stop:492 length:423 start_codon:yes stop_codon:yes gene_type:complete
MDQEINNIEYNKKFLCTYHLLDNLEESDILYKIQFFQAFKIDEKMEKDLISGKIMASDDEIFSYINCITGELFEKYKDNEKVKLLMETYKSENNLYNEEVIFSQLFSYDTFFIMHKIICQKDLSIKEVELLIKKYKPIKI